MGFMKQETVAQPIQTVETVQQPVQQPVQTMAKGGLARKRKK
jgi:hypothetical protein